MSLNSYLFPFAILLIGGFINYFLPIKVPVWFLVSIAAFVLVYLQIKNKSISYDDRIKAYISAFLFSFFIFITQTLLDNNFRIGIDKINILEDFHLQVG